MRARRAPGLASLIVALALEALASTALAEQNDAVSFDARYTGEMLANLSGGIERDSAYLDNLDLLLGIDTGSLWRGSELFFYGLYNNGTPFSRTIAGDLQVASNIETGVRALRLYEAWFQVPLGERSDLRVGLYDLNSEFDVLESSKLFVGSAHGIGTDISQAGVNGPSIFPVTGLAIRLQHRLDDNWSIRGAILDGVPGDPANPDATRIRLSADEGALVTAEIERADESSRVLAGAWGYTARFTESPFDFGLDVPPDKRGNSGVYLRGEKALIAADPALTIFGRIGYAHGDFNVFDYFLSAGVTGKGLVPGRPNDEAGLAVALAETSGKLRDAAAAAGRYLEPREVAFELTYRVSIGKRWAVQPHLQYVLNPGLDPALDDALVAGLRFELGLVD